MQHDLLAVLLGLQIFQVLFLALHDWIPLGRLSDLAAVRAANSLPALVLGTLISTAPFAYGLFLSFQHFGEPLHGLLFYWLWASYTFLFMGELQAWWIPYLVTVEPARAARYETMFGNTWAFLPARHGIRPNTLHVILHTTTLATLVVLGLLTF